MGFLIIIVVLLVFMWFFVLLPQRRRQAQQKAMFTNLKPGDEVLTAGGLYGDVTEIGEDEIAMEISPGVEVRVSMRAIATVVPPDAYEDEEASPEEVEGAPEQEALPEAAAEPDEQTTEEPVEQPVEQKPR